MSERSRSQPQSQGTLALTLKRVLSWGIFIAFAAGVEWWLGWASLLAPWTELDAGQLVIAALLLVSSYLLRAWRVRDYFRDELAGRFWPTFRLATLHNLMNNLLPMRAGEISFPVLMQRYFAIGPTRSVSVLLWFRLLDLQVILTLAAAALLVGLDAPAWFWPLWLVILPMPWLVYALRRPMLARLQGRTGGISRRIAEALEALPATAGPLFRALGWTWANWLVKLAGLAWVLLALLPMPTAAAWLGAIAGDLTTVLPLHAPGGFGTYEAGVIAALLPFGLDAQVVATAAINLHLFLLASSLLAGLLAWLIPVKPSD
ncbi:MAG: lysylphosphatidylglycerol synthase domain-containing protein [Halothiobacillaceae bacterium]